MGCWLSGEVPEPDQGLYAVSQQPGAWALIDLSKPGDKVAVAVRPDAAADPLDGLQFGVAELVLVAGQADRQPHPAGNWWAKVAVGVGDEVVDPGLAEAGVVIVGDRNHSEITSLTEDPAFECLVAAGPADLEGV